MTYFDRNEGPGALALHPLTPEEMPGLYKACLRRDFPPNERRPLALMLRPMKKGLYRGYTALAGGRQVGYALFYGGEGENLLLDYFAVEPALRSAGWGGKMMAALRREIPAGHILIEAEAPGAAKTPEEEEICRRRVAFYTRCGAEDLGLSWRLFGVEYTVLCLPPAGLPPLTPAQGAEAVLALYGSMGLPKAYRMKAPGQEEK